MIKEAVGEKIKTLRIRKGMSQETLANECGLDRTYITYVENAKKNVTIETLYKITQALDISLKDFFDFNIPSLKEKKKEDVNITIDDLGVDMIYTNKEISKMFGCSPQGGMRVSLKNKTITLISQKNGKVNPYNDSTLSHDKSFIYTGMGLVGDQKVSNNNQNGKVAFSDTNGYTIYYFIGLNKNQYQYKGIAKLNGAFYFEDEVDKESNIRKVVKFPLKLI